MHTVPGISPLCEFEFDTTKFSDRERAAFHRRLGRDGPRSMGDFWAALWRLVEAHLSTGATFQEAEERAMCWLYENPDLKMIGPSFRHETICLASALIPQVIEKMKRFVPGSDGASLIEGGRT
jgi:hypothetical protein